MKVTRRQALKTIVSGSTGVLLTQQLGGESSRVLAQAVPQEKPQDKPQPKFRVGVQMQPQHTDWPTYADGVQRFDAMGVDSIWNWDHFFPSLRTALPIIVDRWQKDVPPPLRPIPILIAGSGEKVMLKIVARYATMWNGPLFGPPEEWGRKNQILTEWCTKIGRDPNEIERTVWLESPERLGQLDAYAQAGATHLILGMQAPYPFEAVERLLAWRNARHG